MKLSRMLSIVMLLLQHNKIFIDNTPWQSIQVIPVHIKKLKYALEKNHYAEFQYTDIQIKK